MADIIKLSEHALFQADRNAHSVKQSLMHTLKNNRLTKQALDAVQRDNQRLQKSAHKLENASLALLASSARLRFERARLNRSGKRMQEKLEHLKQSQDTLQAHAEKSVQVAAFCADTNNLIEAIEEAIRQGAPVEHLLEEGTAILNASKKPKS